MPDVPTRDPLLGVRVGSYEIERLIGQGGMGRVYSAVQREVGSRVAIKVLNEEYARDPDSAERFFTEARAVNLIAHENIVSVIDLLRLPDGRPVIVMELLEGETLRQLVHGGPAPIGAVVHVMVEVLSALAATHGAGIVHRDLKPDNILVSPSGRAKVLDFGIAKLVTAQPGQAPRTRTGALVGTPEYMAPEQISGRPVDARTDLYAAGIVLFEALAGGRPFDGASDFEVMRAHVDLPPPSLRQRRAEVPVELEAVILRALAKAPADRFGSATEMANALTAASSSLAEDEWRALVPNGRSYSRPAPLTPPQPRGAHELPTRAPAPAVSMESTIAATPRGRNDSGGLVVGDRGASAGDGRNAAVADSTATVLDAPPPASRMPRILLATAAIAIVGGGAAGVWWSRTDSNGAAAAATVDAGKPTTIERPVTYDPRRFDPVAFYPTAREMARTFLADAELMFFKVVPASEDGTIDLTQASAKQNVYLYRSPPPSTGGERDCVGVEPYADKVIAFVYPSRECDYPLATTAPRCTVAEVWARARTQRTFTATTAHIGFFGEDGGPAYWYLDPSMARRTGAGLRVEDDCR